MLTQQSYKGKDIKDIFITTKSITTSLYLNPPPPLKKVLHITTHLSSASAQNPLVPRTERAAGGISETESWWIRRRPWVSEGVAEVRDGGGGRGSSWKVRLMRPAMG